MALSKPYPIQKADISFGYEMLAGVIDDLLGEGVVASGAFAVTQRAAGANMSADIAAGAAYVDFDTPDGGKRRVTSPATINTGTPGSPNLADGVTQTFTAADATNPRVDRVVLQVRDSNLDAGGNYDAVIRVIAGVASAGATLANLTGAAAVPANAILLANVLIPAAATTVTTANIDTTISTVRQQARVGTGNAGGGGDCVKLYDSVESGVVIPAASITTPALSQAYKHLRIEIVGQTNAAVGNAALQMRCNGDSGGNYYLAGVQGGSSAPAQFSASAATQLDVGFVTGATVGGGNPGIVSMTILDYARAATLFKSMAIVGGGITAAATFIGRQAFGMWANVGPITTLSFFPASGSFAAGSRVTVYGLN